MSQQLISRSPDLKRLRDEGYHVLEQSGFLVVNDVPYVTKSMEIKRGILISELTLAGDRTTTPSTHVVHFAGEYPCDRNGAELRRMEHQSRRKELGPGVAADHSFSSKPNGGYKDYYEKITTYVTIISSPAEALDAKATPRTFPVIESKGEESIFEYIDTASSRAEINLISKKLELASVAIVGMGGTGSYVLDLVAKTPVREIHSFDGDKYSSHNAFRSPGAPSIDELRAQPQKVDYFKDRYSKMHRGIITHDYYIDETNVDQLKEMRFVFLCLEGGTKRLIVEKLENYGVPFVDVGMGLYQAGDSLGGVVRVTTSTPEQREHVRTKSRIPFSDAEGGNEYDRNIQIADLNALNAALAVIKWKKIFGFYLDLENEHHSTYTIDGNIVTNEDRP